MSFVALLAGGQLVFSLAKNFFPLEETDWVPQRHIPILVTLQLAQLACNVGASLLAIWAARRDGTLAMIVMGVAGALALIMCAVQLRNSVELIRVRVQRGGRELYGVLYQGWGLVSFVVALPFLLPTFVAVARACGVDSAVTEWESRAVVAFVGLCALLVATTVFPLYSLDENVPEFVDTAVVWFDVVLIWTIAIVVFVLGTWVAIFPVRQLLLNALLVLAPSALMMVINAT